MRSDRLGVLVLVLVRRTNPDISLHPRFQNVPTGRMSHLHTLHWHSASDHSFPQARCRRQRTAPCLDFPHHSPTPLRHSEHDSCPAETALPDPVPHCDSVPTVQTSTPSLLSLPQVHIHSMHHVAHLHRPIGTPRRYRPVGYISPLWAVHSVPAPDPAIDHLRHWPSMRSR